MKRLIVVGIALALLAGCSGGPGDENATEVGYVDLPDGRSVLCVSWSGVQAGGLSCDWEGAK